MRLDENKVQIENFKVERKSSKSIKTKELNWFSKKKMLNEKKKKCAAAGAFRVLFRIYKFLKKSPRDSVAMAPGVRSPVNDFSKFNSRFCNYWRRKKQKKRWFFNLEKKVENEKFKLSVFLEPSLFFWKKKESRISLTFWQWRNVQKYFPGNQKSRI